MNEHDESVQPLPPTNEPAPAGTPRPAYNDVRDDYDEKFGRFFTPAELVRSKIRTPAIGMIVACSIGIVGAFFGLGVVILDEFDSYRGPEYEVIALAMAGCIAVAALFTAALLGAIAMLGCRKRKFALFAAYVVTGLSLAGGWAILFYPFGIWGLVLLYQPDVRREFERVKGNHG